MIYCTNTINEFFVCLISAAVGTPPLIVVEEFDHSGGLRLLCECEGWNPKPELQWLDSRGENLTSDTEETHKDAKGYNVKHRITVHGSETKYHCRVKLRHHMVQTDIIISSKCMNGVVCLSQISKVM